jgi:hypothetical protein
MTKKTDASSDSPDTLTPVQVETLLLAGDLIGRALRSRGGAREDALETLRAALIGWGRQRLSAERVRELLAEAYTDCARRPRRRTAALNAAVS